MSRNLLGTARRIVTGIDESGQSVVVLDGSPGAVFGAEEGGLAEVWKMAGRDVDPTEAKDMVAEPVRLCPPAGGHLFRLFMIAPEDPNVPPDVARERMDAAFAAIGAESCRPDTRAHPGMHRTPTIDYIILLKGRVRLVLENDTRDLEPFDVVVQRGTNHAWVNTGDEPALLAAVLIDADIASGDRGQQAPETG